MRELARERSKRGGVREWCGREECEGGERTERGEWVRDWSEKVE